MALDPETRKPLLSLTEEDIAEERRKKMEREKKSTGSTVLSGRTVGGKPLLATSVAQIGGGF